MNSITTNDPVCPVCWEPYHANDVTGAVCINRLQTKVRKLELEVELLRSERKRLIQALDFSIDCIEKVVRGAPVQIDEWVRAVRQWRGTKEQANVTSV